MIGLREITLTRPQEKIELVADFNPFTSTWLVADLQSKLELQDRLLEKHEALPDTAVLRISELWQRLARRHLPDWRLSSLDFIRTLFQEYLQRRNFSFARGPRAAQGLVQMMPQLLPLLIQVPEPQLVREWLEVHPESLMRWGHWFEAARELWDELSRRQIMPTSWLAGLLLDCDLQWDQKLVVDLGAQWTMLERRVLEKIRTPEEGRLLRPLPKWAGVFGRALRVYEQPGDQPVLGELKDYRRSQPVTLRHFSTQLAEVKDVVAQVRCWLDQNLRPDEIVLAAQDPEIFWPVLSVMFADEGIPVQKDWLGHFHDRMAIQRGLSRLRLALGDLSFSALETQVYSTDHSLSLPFSRFERLFTHLYGEEQLAWIPALKERFGQKTKPDQVLLRDEWIVWLAQHWPSEDDSDLDPVLKRLAEECGGETAWPLKLWVDLFETLAGKIETPIHEADVEGVRFVRFQAAEWMGGRRLYLLGANEEYLADQNLNQLNHAEVESLRHDLGVALPMSDRAQYEFEARWLLDLPFDEIILSASDCAVTGQALTLSRLFLVQAEDPKSILNQLTVPGRTRGDEIQTLRPDEIAKQRNFLSTRAERLELGLQQDLGLGLAKTFGMGWAERLNASLLERAAECPFHWAASRLFRLDDMPAQDLELDRPSAGRLMHALFERLTDEPRRFDWLDEELTQLIDELGRRLEIYDFGLWPKIRKRHLDLAHRFLASERQWRQQFPSAKTVARELKFKMHLDMSAAKWTASGRGPELVGRIDRVDEAGDELVIYDYKSSGGSLRQPSSWVAHRQYQLALYAEAVEARATTLPGGEVKAALYFVARDMSRDKGFRLKESCRILPDPSRSALTAEQKEKLWHELNKQIVDLVARLQNGEMAPKPQDPSVCLDCAWRSLCRAAHLN